MFLDRPNVPVVENLAAQNMPADTPAVLIPFLPQPVVAKELGVEVVRLKRRMVDVTLGALEHEEAMVIHELLAAVKMHECGDVRTIGVVDELEDVRMSY